MKKILLGVLVIIIAVVFFATRDSQAEPLIGESILVSTFTSEGVETGKTLFQVPFLKSLEERGAISIAIDFNSDESFETVVDNFPVSARADWRSGYYGVPSAAIEEGMNARVTVNGEIYDAHVVTKTVEVGNIFDLGTVTDPENSMKGWGASVAYADEGHNVEVTIDGVTDLNQRIGECAPTSAANSLISLVNRNGGEDLVAGDPQDFIENLKRHMNWTPENGVLPDDFVAGKNRWAAAAGVPIRTEKVGDTQGISTVDAIREALQNGDGVELRIKFATSDRRFVGGHMVTVVGIHQGEGQTYLEINDPGTPDSGTETVEIRSNQITNYGPWDGLTLLSWGFTQTWEGHPTGELLDTMTDEEIAGIRQFAGETPMITVIQYGGKYIPVSQLKVTEEEGCEGGKKHWHSISSPVTATDGTEIAEPPVNCGFGTVASVPSMNIPAPNNND